MVTLAILLESVPSNAIYSNVSIPLKLGSEVYWKEPVSNSDSVPLVVLVIRTAVRTSRRSTSVSLASTPKVGSIFKTVSSSVV